MLRSYEPLIVPGYCRPSAHAGLLGGFVMADLDGQSPMVYLETAAEGQVSNGGNCVEVGTAGPVVAVRDSKDTEGPRLAFAAAAWTAFADQLKADA